MADLNFSVGLIKDQLTKDLGDIKKELENFEKNHPLSFNVILDGKKLGEQIETLNGKTVSINVEVGNLQKVTDSLENLKNVIGKGSNPIPLDKLFGFNDLDQRINKFVADMQNKLSQATSEHAFKVGTGHIENLSIDINKIATDMRNALTIVPSGNFEEVKAQIERISQAFQPLKENTELFNASSKNMQSKLNEIAASIAAVQSVTDNPNTFNGFQKQILEMMGMIGQIAEVVRGNVEAVARAIKDMKLDHFGESIKKVSDSLAELTGNVEKFGTAMANDKGMRDFITGLGAMISMVKNNVDSLRGKGIGETDMSKGVVDMTKNYEKLNDAIMRLDQAKQRAQGEISIANAVGLNSADTQGIREYISVLDMVRTKLMELHADSGRMVQKNVFTTGFWNIQEVEQILKVIKGADATLATDSTAIAQLFNALVREVGQYSQSLNEAKNGTDQVANAMEKLKAIQVSLAGSIGSGLLNPQDMQVLIDEQNRINTLLNILQSGSSTKGKIGVLAQESGEIAKFAQDAKIAEQAVKKIKADNDELAQSTVKATNKYVELEGVLQRLNSVKTKGDAAGADTSKLDQEIAKVQVLKNLMEEIKTNKGKTNAGQLFQEVIDANAGVVQSAKNAAQAIKDETRELTKNTGSKSSNASSTRKLTEEEKNLQKAISETTNAGKQQSQVLSDLRSMAMQYASVWGSYNLAKEIAQVTGELELQKTSLEVIVGSASTAADLYGQIREMSQQSPYTFQDLMKAERQLAAFNISTPELYSTMRSLTNIGAGLSVDVSRLILAFGHTKAYGYLSGIQNRQFETAGIDLMGELAKMYNKRADEAAKQGIALERTNRMDLYKKMRARAIPFEDVQEVILGLDKEGGKFFNMQERQFDTLGGKLRNLTNNYNIMLSEFGQSQHGLFMGAVEGINTLTANWKKVWQIVQDVIAAYGVLKATSLGLNLFGANFNKGGDAYRAAMKENASQRRQDWVIGRNNVKNVTGTTLGTAYGRAIAQSSELSRVEKIRAMLHKNVTDDARRQLVTQGLITKEYAKQIGQMGTMRLWAERIRLSFKMAMAELGAGLKALMLNPVTWITAVVSGAFALWNYYKGIKETVNGITKSTQENAEKDANTLHDYRSENLDIFGDGTNSKEDKIRRYMAIRSKGVMAVVEELQKQLENIDPLYKGNLFNLNKFQDETQKAMAMADRLKEIEDARNFVKTHGGDFANTNEKTHNILTDSFAKDVKDYEEASQEVTNAISDIDRKKMEEFMEEHREFFTEIARQYGLDMKRNGLKVFRMGMEAAFGAQDGNGEEVWNFGKAKFENLVKALGDKMQKGVEVNLEMDMFGRTAANQFIEGFREGTITKGNFGTIITDQMKGLLESDAYKVSDPAMQQEIITRLMMQVPSQVAKVTGEGTAEVKASWDALNVYMSQVVGNRLVDAMKGIAQKAKGPGASEIIMAAGYVREEMEREFGGFTDWLHHESATWRKLITQAFYQAKGTEDDVWKKDARKYFKGSALDSIITECKDAITWLDAARKKVKEVKETIDGQKAHFQIVLGMTATTSAKAFLDAYKAKYGQDLSKQYSYITGKSDKVSFSEYSTAQTLYQDLLTMDNVKGYKDETGYDLDPDKKKKTRHGRSTDNWLKERTKEFENLKKFRQEYEKWLKVFHNEDAAFEYTRKIFKDLNIPKSAIVSMKGYTDALTDLQERVRKVQNQGDKEGRKQLVNNIGIFRDSEMAMQDFKQKSDEYVSQVQEAMKELQQAWDMYKTVRDATGDAALAASLSQLGNDADAGNYADHLKGLIIRRMQSVGLPSNGFTFDAKASNKEIENAVGAVFGEGADDTQREQIEAIITLIKKWRDLMQDLSKTSTSAMAKLLGDINDYASKIKKINDAYSQNIDSIRKSEGTPEEKARTTEIAEDKQKIALMEIKPETIRYYEAITTLNKQAARQIANDLIEAYKHSFDIGRISAEDYFAKVKEILSKLNERGAGKRTIFDRMGNLFFNRKNNQDAILGAWLANTARIGQLMKLPDTPDNKTERTTRERLATALNNSYLGYGGLKERRIASAGSFIADNVGNVAKWQSILDDPNASKEEKKEAQKMLNRYSKEKATYDKLTKGDDGKGKNLDFMERLRNGAEEAAKALSDMSSLAGDASGMFASFGNKETAGVMGDVGNIVGAGADIAKGIATGNPVAAIGGTMKMVSALNAAHDNKLKRQIEVLQENNAALEANTKAIKSARARTLGYDNGSLLKQYQREAIGSMKSFYTTGGATGYRAEYNNLVALRNNHYSILSKQERMKNKSESDILATKEKIAELDDQIKFYVSDVAAELWSIDLKDWASQISDALCTAFENGENAAKAYRNVVTSIMQQVMNSMMKVGILEPMFKSLQEKLFGKNGLFDLNDVQGSMGQVTAYLAQFFGEGGDGYNAINAAIAFTNGFEDVMKQYGLSVKNKDANKLSSSIQGTSEETSDLLAAYVNALRQDVSILRLFTEEFITEKWEDYINSLTGSGSHLANIDKNILAIKTLFEQNGDLYNAITRIDNDLHSVIYGQQSVKMR